MQSMYFPSASPPWLLAPGVLLQDEDIMAVQTGNASYGYWMGYVNRVTN